MSSPASTDWPLAHASRRLAAAAVDAILLVAPCAALILLHPLVALAGAVAYGTALEAGAHRATPGKRLCGIEAMPPEGGRLPLRATLLRNVLKYGGLAFALSAWGLLVPLAVFAPAFGPARRGLHDLAARSFVRHQVGQGLSDVACGALAIFGPVLFVVALLPLILSPVTNARARDAVEAALRDAQPRRSAVEAYAAANGRLPDAARIELRLEGIQGSVVLMPQMRGTEVRWTCRGEGIPRGKLPQQCRPQD
jgi:uncharacterized RDD family membrane protein YckC